MQTASVYTPILIKEKQTDGTLLVTGIATDDTLDIDEQICDPAWLEAAMPAWFEYGNIREQHSNIAAGVATKLEVKGTQHQVTAHVVDPVSVAKVESGVLKGFSIGIRDPRIISDKSAPGGRIVGGEIVEVSLVDRPANPSCLLELAKSVGGTVRQLENLIVKEGAAVERCDKCGKACKSEDMDGKMCKACKAAETSEASEQSEEQSVGDETTTEPEASTAGDVNAAADTEESSQPEGEESSQEVGEESSRPGGVAGVAGKELPDSEGEVSSAEHEQQEMDVLQAVLEALARIESVLSAKADDSTKAVDASVKALEERVAKVEKSASRGPVRTAVKSAPQIDVKAALAADYRAKAAATSDPALAQGYLLLAADAETN